jgi:hypothetical protein
MTLEQIKDKALEAGATRVAYSNRKGKKYMVEYKNKIIHFGSDAGQTFLDHGNEQIKSAWVARHSKIKNKYGQFVYLIKESPAWWSYHILW